NKSKFGLFNGDIGIIDKIINKKNFKSYIIFVKFHQYNEIIQEFHYNYSEQKITFNQTMNFYSNVADDEEIDNKNKVRIDLNLLIHAYAITIDKSQGSEYNFVIIITNNVNPNFLHRNRLYTAITRSKFFIVMIVDQSIKNIINCATTNPKWRCSSISYFLSK